MILYIYSMLCSVIFCNYLFLNKCFSVMIVNHTEIVTNHTEVLTNHTEVLTNHTEVLTISHFRLVFLHTHTIWGVSVCGEWFDTF